MEDTHFAIYSRCFHAVVEDILTDKIGPDDRENSKLLWGLLELRDNYELLMDECASPIEKQLGAGLLFGNDGYNPFKYIPLGPDEFAMKIAVIATHEKLWGTYFAPQVPLYGYKIDFLFASVFSPNVVYTAVECDGHDYHDRTKEQASHDRRRDRKLASKGITTLRFTGSDIYRKLDDCIEEMEMYFFRQMESMLEAAGKVTPKKRGA